MIRQKIQQQFIQVSNHHHISPDYIQTTLDRVSSVPPIRKQQILQQQTIRILTNSSTPQHLRKLTKQRDIVLTQLRHLLVQRKKIDIESVTQLLITFRYISLMVIEGLMDWKKQASYSLEGPQDTYTHHIVHALANSINFLRYTPLSNYIQFSKNYDPFFLHPLKHPPHNSNQHSPMHKFFHISELLLKRFERANQFVKYNMIDLNVIKQQKHTPKANQKRLIHSKSHIEESSLPKIRIKSNVKYRKNKKVVAATKQAIRLYSQKSQRMAQRQSQSYEGSLQPQGCCQKWNQRYKQGYILNSKPKLNTYQNDLQSIQINKSLPNQKLYIQKIKTLQDQIIKYKNLTIQTGSQEQYQKYNIQRSPLSNSDYSKRTYRKSILNEKLTPIKQSQIFSQAHSYQSKEKFKQNLSIKPSQLQQNQLIPFLSLLIPNKQKELKRFLNEGYFKKRHICLTLCYFGSQLMSISLTHQQLSQKQRFLYIILFKIVIKKYQSLISEVVDAFINYYFQKDPITSIIYLNNQQLSDQLGINTLNKIQSLLKNIKTPIQSQFFQKDGFLVMRNSQNNLTDNYCQVISASIYFIFFSTNRKLAVKNQAYFTKKFIQLAYNQNNQQIQRVNSLGQVKNYLLSNKYEKIPKSLISQKKQSQISIINIKFNDNFTNIRYCFISNSFYITLEPSNAYFFNLNDDNLLIIKTIKQNQFYIFYKQSNIPIQSTSLQSILNKIDGKNIKNWTQKPNVGKTVILPKLSLQKQFDVGQDNICCISFKLNFNQYIKGTRILSKQDIIFEFQQPFYFGIIRLSNIGIANCLTLLKITESDKETF